MLRDLECGERKPPVAVLAAVVLPAAELEDDDLLLAILRDDLRLDLRAGHEGGADLDRVAADEEHLVEGHGIAHARGELLDPELVALCDLVLLAARFDPPHMATCPLLLCFPAARGAPGGGGGSRGTEGVLAPGRNGTREYTGDFPSKRFTPMRPGSRPADGGAAFAESSPNWTPAHGERSMRKSMIRLHMWTISLGSVATMACSAPDPGRGTWGPLRSWAQVGVDAGESAPVDAGVTPPVDSATATPVVDSSTAVVDASFLQERRLRSRWLRPDRDRVPAPRCGGTGATDPDHGLPHLSRAGERPRRAAVPRRRLRGGRRRRQRRGAHLRERCAAPRGTAPTPIQTATSGSIRRSPRSAVRTTQRRGTRTTSSS